MNIVMLLTNSVDELSDIPPISCKDEKLKMLSLDQQVTAQNVYNMSGTVAFKSKIRETCIVIWGDVMNKNDIWQCADSM